MYGINSIAIPAISSGIFCFPLDECAEIMLDEVSIYSETNKNEDLEVILCNFDDKTTNMFWDKI